MDLRLKTDDYAPVRSMCIRCVCFLQYPIPGKERDIESGNDYFEARYFSSAMGRFMSPDWAAKAEPVPYAKMDNPQSLKLYSYVENNPLTNTDADGHEKGCITSACRERLARPASPEIRALAKRIWNDPGVQGWLFVLTMRFCGEEGAGVEEGAAAGLARNATLGERTAAWFRNFFVKPIGSTETEAPILLSKGRFGHTFVTHGQDVTKFLTFRAAGSGMEQGQFLDNQAAARFINSQLSNLKNGAETVPIPADLPARIITPDGSYAPATGVREWCLDSIPGALGT